MRQSCLRATLQRNAYPLPLMGGEPTDRGDLQSRPGTTIPNARSEFIFNGGRPGAGIRARCNDGCREAQKRLDLNASRPGHFATRPGTDADEITIVPYEKF